MTRYELLERIGAGGMAEIFRGKAIAAGGFEKPVAIKRILPHLSQDTRFVELLIAEAKVLSLLKHRNIVQIFDVGLGDDQQYFLVMEYVDGKDLGAIQRALEQKRRRIPFDLALHIGAEICEALEHAHTARAPDGKSMSLVHRDVSPSNVLLSRAGEVKLTDFGIAKRAESDATQGGAVRGKFAYISPEQARNEALDPRADVFSVALLMWELICNRRLFSGLDDLSALRAVRDPNIPRPSQVDPKLTPEVDQILMTALAKDKSRRYPSAGAFGQKLRALRYSLETTSGDPATELAKIIDSTEQLERESQQLIAPSTPSGRFDFDGGEATVIRIRTADAFSNNDASIVKARQVIDRFEEEETRLAQLSGDQLKMLRSRAPRDSNEMTAAAAPLRSRRDSSTGDEEATRMRAPIDVPFEPSNVTPSDQTRLIAPRDRRTPLPQRAVRPPTAPPPMPPRSRGPTPGPPMPMPAPPLPGLPMSGLPSTLPGSPAPIAPAPAMGQLPMPPQGPPMPPQGPPQNLGISGGPGLPFQPSPPAAPYPAWGSAIAPQRPPRDATPTARDSFDRPMFPPRPSQPQVAGFGAEKKKTLKPWVLVVGALVMALLAFAITRAFIR
ncbi:MAG: serine/threonine protein kinase [Deltaproteobacteria bacterium]|nr:serine/threonine protein kinase [Deltaproteobacteria bacterium]